MAKEPKKIEAVGEDFIADESKIKRVSHEFPFPREVVWNALLDGETWTKWLPITKVEWTSPKPYKVGTTRTVWIGEQVVEEVFFGGERASFTTLSSLLSWTMGGGGGGGGALWKYLEFLYELDMGDL